MSGGLRIALAALLLGLSCPIASAAEEGAERRFTWRPSVQLRAVLSDDITLNNRSSDGDLGIWMAPRLELAYRAPAFELGADGSLDVRRYSDSKSSDETFYRVHSFAEAGLLPGLSIRVSDAYTPQPQLLGLPDDEPNNLVQTNRAEVELRYWRELPGRREITIAALGSRFDTDRFAALVEAPNGSVALDPGFRADFWEGAAVVEFQNPFGDHHAGYVRGLVRQRDFEDAGGADHLEVSGLIGFRSHLERGIEFDAAGGYGLLDIAGGGSESSLLGRAALSVRRPGGWHYHAAFHNEFTVDIAGNDFVDTTGRLGIEKFFGPRTAVSLIGFLSQLESDSTRPSGNLFGGTEVKLRRALARRFQASLAYRYWENAGSFGLDDLSQSRLMLTLTYRH
jgi:hypothetical protein